ncbi:S-DNA-T family DNA segregation ATPase FtsK/SpoIIIE [Prauserella shujinwangii]|uniref:S-DNA-T family DNA segregation ATPase FtsK/SpoIIIE n=1 Tax=Prauserella shujinwangii TaxID=1453103 RepID=A0A2T0LPW1_9PSEU|nr:cell division protein FtsK [Prauserella shujinwangii]PRX45340.1 S-DNA-T family DNA segregation ATPase FtsK/SpoIIIE [Prauserella shujinwangii]
MSTEHDNEHTGEELARVHYLPTHDATGLARPVEAEVVEGELVSDAEYRRLTSEKAKALARYQAYKRDLVVVGRVTRRVATHERTKSTAKTVARHVLYVPAGAAAVGKRLWDAKSSSLYERQKRAAELAGDLDRLQEWESRAELFKERRHKRVMDWLDAPFALAKAVAVGIASVVALLLALGMVLAVADSDAGLILAPIAAVIDFVRWVAWVVTIVWGPLVLAAPWVAVLYLWNEGRKRNSTPAWLQPSATAGDGEGSLVTADGIVRALQHLSIPALNRAFKDGWVPRFDLTPTREGHGVFKGFRAIVDLPMGVTPEMVADKRAVLAKNLNRNAVEVWPSDYGKEKGGKPGFVNLYVADSGVMDKPTPDYPLLHDGAADVFAGVPVGITQRGEQVPFCLVGSNFVFGGQPGQGKSNGCRVVMLGAALDPLAELRVHVFAMNGDFDAYAPRLSRYHKGTGSEHAEQATEHLHELYAEVTRREARLAEIGAKKLTRPVAEKHPDLRPLIVLFSECHELFGHAEFGKQAAELAVAVVKRGRKTGVVLGFDTQSARTDAIPGELVENVGINGCFAVKTWRSNDGFLGDGSFAAGIRATDLRFNVDRGTMVVTGVGEELFEIVRTFFIAVDDDTGFDAATDVIARAMGQLAPGTPVAGDRPAPQIEQDRDLLADLDTVLGTERVPAGDVLGALRNLAPRWRPYQDHTVPTFVAALKELGVKVARTGNRNLIDPVTVRERLAEQSTDDLDE